MTDHALTLRAALFAALSAALFAAAPLTAADTQATPQNSPQETNRYNSALYALIDEIEAFDKASNPFSAGEDGDAAARRRLADVSLEAQRRSERANAVFLARYKALPVAGLSDEDQLNYDLIGFVLNQRAKLSAMDEARIPFRNDSGFFSSAASMSRNMRFDSAQDYDDYIARMNDIPRLFGQHIDNMRRGIKTGYTASADIMPGILTGIENLTAIAPEDHSLYAPFTAMSSKITPERQEELRSAAMKAMTENVMPAYRQLLGFMETEYAPKARPAVGLSSLPGGKAQYETLVKYFTTLDLSPEEVHAIGEAEVKRIRARMEGVIKESGFEGTFSEFLNFLRTDPQFYATSREDLLKEAAWIAKQADGKMPEYFRTLPRLSYGVIPVPESLEKNYTTGRYFGGNAKQGKAGNYVVNTYNLKNRPLYNLPALTLHEGVPGHHHQISLAAEQENVPKFRQNLYPHAFGEGWGLYSEMLGEEMGIYKTPYDQFGRLTYEMWRACRLVMDTGMHYMGWSREKAENCLYENSALAPHNITTETDRYISWPGQALAYKIGELKIIELRERAEKALGAGFDIRDFHDAVLVDGALPMSLLEQRIDRWIAAQRKAQDSSASNKTP